MTAESQPHFEVAAAWIGVIGTLLGTAIGFFLSLAREKWVECRKRERLHRALDEELRSNLYVLPAKMAIIRQCQQAIKENEILDTRGVPFLRALYDNNLPDLSASLTIRERNALHVIYSNFRIIDGQLDSFCDQLVTAPTEKTELVIKRIVAAMGDFSPLFDSTEALIKSYLNKEPIDVFHTEMSLDKLKAARFV